jgi:predicted dehydrogenase
MGFDQVVICAHAAGADPVELAGSLARDRAAVVAVGAVDLHVPRKPYYEKELRLIVSRSYGPGRYDPIYEEHGIDYPIGYVRWTEQRNLEAFLGLLAEGRLDVRPLVSHRFPIERAGEAYDLITARGAEPFLGVLLTYPQQGESPIVRRLDAVSAARRGEAGVRLGALGAGSFAGGVLFPALKRLPGIELMGVAAASGQKAEHAARRFGFRFAATDETEILHHAEINAVAVLTRHHLHAGQTIAALRAGKHVLCEKPLALNREELAQVVAAQQESGRLLCVGFNRRFAPMAVQLRQAFSDVHEPLMMNYRVNAGALPANHWLLDPVQGGGRIIGEGCHFIDFLTFLSEAEPVSVHAYGLTAEGRAAEENVALTVAFADGSVGSITYTAIGDRAFPKERVEVFGGGRAAVLDDFRRLEIVSGGRKQTRRAWLRQDKGHARLWQAFAEAVASGGPAPISIENLTSVALASFAAVDSLRAGGPRPVGRLSLSG